MIASAHAAEESGDFLQAMTLGSVEESVLDLMVIAPAGDADSLPFPVLEKESGDLVDYDLNSGVMTLAIDGALSCFDLRTNWQNSAVSLDVYSKNAVTVDGEKLGAIAQLGLSSDLHYLFDPPTLALDAAIDTACFYDSGTGMELFGRENQGGNLEVSFQGLQPGNWPYVGITDPIEYQVNITNTGSTNIERLAVQELFDRSSSSVNFPAGLFHLEYACEVATTGDCADAAPEIIVIDADLGIEYNVPFIRGEALSLPAGATITFTVEREVRLSGGADLQEAFGHNLPIHFVAVDLDNPANHAAATETLQVVGTGQISAEAEDLSPTVSADGTVSTMVTVQIENSQGQPLEESGIEITAEVDPTVSGDINFPASLLTTADGTASFWIQSEKAGSYEITFSAPALFEDGQSVPASDSVILDFQAGSASAFEFSADFPDPSLSPSTLPPFEVLAVDQFGNVDVNFTNSVSVSLIDQNNDLVGNLQSNSATDGIAQFNDFEIPGSLSGSDFYLQAFRLTDPILAGTSNAFDLIIAPEGDLSINLNSTPADGQSIAQASDYLLNITASNVSVDPSFELAVVVTGRAPLDTVDRPINEFCSELFTDLSCPALLASFGLEAGFDIDSTLFEDTVTVRANADPGTWELDFQLVMVTAPDEYLLVDTIPVDLTVNAVANAATGSIVIHRNGGTMDPSLSHTVREGELVDFGLSVINASVSDNRRLAVVFDGQGPGDTTNQPGMDICLALMEADSCAALDDLIGFDNHFAVDIDLVEDLLVQILQEDALGEWLLNFYLVSFDPTEAESIEVVSDISLELEVIENTAQASLKVVANEIDIRTQAQPLTLVQGQSFNLEIELEDIVLDSTDDIEAAAVIWAAEGPGFDAPLDGEEACPNLLQADDCDSLTAAIGLDNLYTSATVIFNQTVALEPDVAIGTWNLEFWLVVVENGNTILMEIHSQEIQVISDRLFEDRFVNGLID